MKSLLLLVCCLGVMAEIRATHVVGSSQDPALFSHLPDESNFQASGGAALGSFGGFTRVIVLLVVLLGVVYHGFVPAVLLGVEPRPAAVSLPMRKLSNQRDESVLTALESVPEPKVTISPEIRTEVTQKISKQAAKKLAKKAAKKLVEAAKVTEEKKAAVKEVVVVEKKKKSKENKIVVAPNKCAEEVVVQEAETVGVEKLDSTQDNIFTIPFQVTEQVLEKLELMEAEQVQTVPQDQQEKEEGNLVKPAPEEAREEVLNKGWVLNSPRVRERTSVTIRRVKRGLNAEQLLSVRQNRASVDLQNDLDYDSFVVDPRTVNCPEFMKLAAAPIVVEDASPLEIAEQETPASIQPVRDKLVSPLVPEFISMDHGSEPAPPQVEDAGNYFNSHKKTAWVQRQSRSAWPSDTLPGLAQMAQLPWSPIRTPCKFAAGCKKPGCQFTHPANAVPAWVVPVF